MSINDGNFTLTGSGTPGSCGPINSYQWDLNYKSSPFNLNTFTTDTRYNNQTTIYPAFGEEGKHTVVFKVGDNCGGWAIDTATVYVYSGTSGNSSIPVLYVKKGGTGYGTSWNDAIGNIQTALDYAALSSKGAQIWVAQGSYIPSKPTVTGDPRSATFQLVNSVSLYGGFNGTETSLEQRDWQAYPTVLSGDIDQDDNDANSSTMNDNAYHVVTGSDANTTAVLDGFTIRGGNAAGGNEDNKGGGMFGNAGSPTVTNCTFVSNKATWGGGGMYNANGSNPAVTNCTFTANSADFAGAVYNKANSNPAFTNCTFNGNEAKGPSWGNAGAMLTKIRPAQCK